MLRQLTALFLGTFSRFGSWFLVPTWSPSVIGIDALSFAGLDPTTTCDRAATPR